MKNGHNAIALERQQDSAGTDEEQLDDTIDASFPASDPPSFTPVTGTTESTAPHKFRFQAEQPSQPSRGWLVLGTLVAMAIAVPLFVWRRNRHKRRTILGIQVPEKVERFLPT